MDGRWQPINRDSAREVKFLLHPTAALHEVRRGTYDTGSDDSVDLSEFVKTATQSAFDLNVTLVFNRELFGQFQPKPDQVIEVRLLQAGVWQSLWMGYIDAISSFTMQRGDRQMQLVAKTREQQDIWKNTPRVTPLFPQLTNLVYISQFIARMVDLKSDEMLLPPSSHTTAHSNTQMANMTAWEMIETIFQALGWTPFIDNLGRLRAANRSLQSRVSDVKLSDDRMVKVGGQRQRPPINRVKVTWLDPELKVWRQQGRKLAGPVVVTIGWFIPYWKVHVDFSEDGTQRALGTYKRIISSVNKFAGKGFCREHWTPQTVTGGKLSFINYGAALMAGTLLAMWKLIDNRKDGVHGTINVIPGDDNLIAPGFEGPVHGVINVHTASVPSSGVPDTLFTTPVTSKAEAALYLIFMAQMMMIGTGSYEIWGIPYEYVHAKNVSEAFDSSRPTWVNNVQEITCDLIANEEHAKAMAIRELIYSARAANKWSVTIVDDPRIEYGDILEFPDGSQLYVEDFSRGLERGTEAILDVKGFLVGPPRGQGKTVTVVGGTPDIGIGAPGGPGGGPGGEDPNAPGPWDGVPGSDSAHPIVTMSSDPAQIARDVGASWDHFAPISNLSVLGPKQYWIDKALAVDQFSDGKFYLGHNKYWEDRMDPANPGYPGSANAAGGTQQAIYRA